ncbi:hypothetical protein K440DRAFT_633590 [Wilcoxina mikolae CBS 423.85]|nr:hypothetical protein K440DRAFT_633590 [Wilcoxina mikolae CBS 423.85]
MPPEVQRLVLTYASKVNDGHMGPRKFWRLYLPRLKYHNPEIQMDVIQNKTTGGPATLVVEFNDRKEVIDCQHKHENDIVKALFEITRAKPIPIDARDSILANEYLQDKEQKLQAERAKLARRAAKREEERLAGGMPAA